MKTAAVICEWNPFHRGHQVLLEQMRQSGCTHIVGIMSGHFTQRAEPAFADKYTRAAAALSAGADLVIELPVFFSCFGAQRFALGGIQTAEALGNVEELFFGSESGDLPQLTAVARLLREERFSKALRPFLQQGLSYAAARTEAVRTLSGEACAALLCRPNDSLGIEYISALQAVSSRITPHAVLRTGCGHEELQPQGEFASSSAIRARQKAGERWLSFLPEEAGKIIGNASLPDPDRLETALLYRLRSMTAEELKHLPEVEEGLEHRLLRALSESTSIEQVLERAKTKRYTHARLKRILLYALLHFCRDDLPQEVPYIRVLGMSQRGQEVLRSAGQTARVPLLLRHKDSLSLSGEARRRYEQDSRCDDIFSLCYEPVLPAGYFRTKGIVRVSS